MHSSISLDDLRVFYEIAEDGTISGVSKATGVTQPTLTRSIKNLEAALGVSLYFRKRDGMALTAAGLKLHQLLKERLTPLNNVIDLFREDLSSPSGNLKIATTYTFGSLWLPRRLDKFYIKYPRINLDIYATDEKIDIYNRVDAAVSFQPYDDSNVIDHEILSYELRIYASKEYLNTYGTPQSISELKNHKILVYGDNTRAPTPQVNWLVKNEHGGYVYHPLVKLNSAQGLMEAVKRGVGIATLATYIAKDDPDLIELKIDTGYPPVKIYFSYHTSMANSIRIKSLREFITQELNS